MIDEKKLKELADLNQLESRGINFHYTYKLNEDTLDELEKDGIPNEVLKPLRDDLKKEKSELLNSWEENEVLNSWNVYSGGISFFREKEMAKYMEACIGKINFEKYRSKILPRVAKVRKLAVTTNFSYGPILIDFLLRWALFGLLKLDYINNPLFFIGQLLIICVTVWGFGGVLKKRVKSKILKDFQKYGINLANMNMEIELNVKEKTFPILFSVFVVLSMAFMIYNLIDHPYFEYYEWYIKVLYRIFDVFKFLFFVLIYTWIIIETYNRSPKYKSAKEKVSRDDSIDEIEEGVVVQGETQYIPELKIGEKDIDENDLDITKLEVETASISQRIDTYTLEGALFAALAFSGFLTIIIEDRSIIGQIEKLLSFIYKLLLFEVTFQDFTPILSDSSYILAAVTLETLVCSLFFTFVIVSRLRFTDILEKVKYLINIARAYNSKEEDIFHSLLSDSKNHVVKKKRLAKLNFEVSKYIKSSNDARKECYSILEWMKWCRNIGIGMFIFILITSALLISKSFAFIFLVLSILALTFTKLEDIIKQKRIEDILPTLNRPKGQSK